MKIPDIKGLVSIARGVIDTRKGQPIAQQRGLSAGTDKVELSSQGQVVHRLAAERTDDRARASFVAELKAQYEKGELRTDSQATAKAMVADGMFDDLYSKR